MKIILDVCFPQDVLLQGELMDEMFAARLLDVIELNAAPVYVALKRLFGNTHPTKGLKCLLREVFSRLSEKMPSTALLSSRNRLLAITMPEQEGQVEQLTHKEVVAWTT